MKIKSDASRRLRRSSAVARAQIIAAAQVRISKLGPGGLRLQDVAADVGVSHPALLHHFGSREGLLQQVQAHSVERMRDALLTSLSSTDGNSGLVPTVFEAFQGGLAHQLVWISQSSGFCPTDVVPFQEIVDALYAKRVKTAKLGVHPRKEDTVHMAHLVVVAALGDALLGSLFRNQSDPIVEERERVHFQQWLQTLFREHLAAQTPNT